MLRSHAVFGLLLVLVSSLAAAPPVTIQQGDAQVTIQVAQQPLLTYQYVEHPYKPYLPLFATPTGVNILRDSPEDHIHHHGMMFAVAAGGLNFWEERKDHAGIERNRGLSNVTTTERGGTTWATLSQDLDWVQPSTDTLMLREQRTLAATVLDNATVLVWKTRLATPPGQAEAKLSGSHYFGLGMRFLPSMDQGGQFRNAEGNTGVKETDAHQSAWCAYSAQADGHPVTVAMFAAPGNSQPTTWFTKDQGFAYLSATLALHKKPLLIPSGAPLELGYAVALWDGQVTPETIQQLFVRLGSELQPAQGR